MSTGTPGPYHVFRRNEHAAIYISTDIRSTTRALLSSVAVIYPTTNHAENAAADAANISQLPAMLKLVNWLSKFNGDCRDPNLCREMIRDFGIEARQILEAIRVAREA